MTVSGSSLRCRSRCAHAEFERWVRRRYIRFRSGSLDGHGLPEGGELLVIDGPLRGRQHLPRALGYIKSHDSEYRPQHLGRLVASPQVSAPESSCSAAPGTATRGTCGCPAHRVRRGPASRASSTASPSMPRTRSRWRGSVRRRCVARLHRVQGSAGAPRICVRSPGPSGSSAGALVMPPCCTAGSAGRQLITEVAHPRGSMHRW